MCIVVKDKADVAAFANFQPSDDDSAPTAAPVAPKAEAAAPPPPPPPQPQPTPPPPVQKTVAPPPPPPPQAAPAPQQPAGGRVFASPLAKRLASERNIDLSVCLSYYAEILSLILT